MNEVNATPKNLMESMVIYARACNRGTKEKEEEGS